MSSVDASSDITKFIQAHFTDGLVLVVGSGLSAAEGIPGMLALADHLISVSAELTGKDAACWKGIAKDLANGSGLETALLNHTPTDTLNAWIVNKTCNFLLPNEQAIISRVIKGEIELRLTTFLSRILKPTSGLPILTPNYDRLIELACEMSGFHVDTTAIGHYAGEFDYKRSCMGSAKGIITRGKTLMIDHFPRAIVLKPHGSFDWYGNGTSAHRCSIDIDAERLIITPGSNKYKAGYNIPFDKHRELANTYIDQAAKLLIVGYGFNDDHLQTHLLKKICDGTPTLILTHTASMKVRKLAEESVNCVCLVNLIACPGFTATWKGTTFDEPGLDLWDIGVLAKELLT